MSDTITAINVQCLDHVTVIVKDLEESRKFYVDVLGMQQVARPEFSFDGSWFQAGDTQIHLILEHGESGPAGRPLPEQSASSRTHHFAFQVSDAYQAAEHLKQSGISLVSGPKPRPDGAVQVFVEDPDGHVVELCSAPTSRSSRGDGAK